METEILDQVTSFVTSLSKWLWCFAIKPKEPNVSPEEEEQFYRLFKELLDSTTNSWLR